MGRRPVVRSVIDTCTRAAGPLRTVLAAALGVAVLAACAGQDGGSGYPQGRSGTSPPASSPPPSRPSSPSPPSPSDSAGSASQGQVRQAGKALLKAAGDGEAKAVRAALASGADTETRDGRGRTALLLASLGDHVEAARVLVKAGADPDAQDEREDSAWLVTGVTGSVEMARVLVPGKPDYTVTNRYGGTSLIPASERGHVGYVREVLRTTGIKVDHVNRLGWTALLEAVILGDGGRDHQKVAGLLLDAGASPGIADKDGVTPLRHAEKHGYDEIAKLLRDAARGGG